MLTVLLATKNRAELLGRVLESFCFLEVPDSGWKLIVVDNGSRDRTPEVLEGFRERLPLQSLVEVNQGKNAALNAGLRLVEGDLTVLTDDDVFPHRDWLVQLRKAADAQPQCSIFGGAIVPRWEAAPPLWVGWVDLGPVFTLTDPNREQGETLPLLIYGPNMAVRSEVFRAGVRFNPSVGPRGSNYAMGSESELLSRLGRAGHRAYFVPQAVVEHFVRKNQFALSWVLKRAFRYGRGFFRLFRMGLLDEPISSRTLGIPKTLIYETMKGCKALCKGILLLRRESIFRASYHLNFLRGQIVEARRILRQQRLHLNQTVANNVGDE
jgi:L-malate glycosyltransferase